MAVSLPMQERGSAAVQTGTCSQTKPFSPLVPSRLAIVVISICCAVRGRQGRVRLMYMHRSYNEIMLRMGLLCLFFPQRFDTVITVHLEEKL